MDLDNLKDRKMKKWRGFYMPEQVSMVKQMWIDEKKIQMPLIDDYQVQEFEEKIHFAKENKLPIEFTVFDNGFTEIISGKIHSFDGIEKKIKLIMHDNTFEYILFPEIINVKLID
ncbi:YolD-like family protein [Margalitia sp. FSL K6-0131]|uniref:YolD-like family protein n=1 Tax=Margalitia sp. FSL K6-0131 TaxID=2954604 RepID=UPI0030F80E2D